MTYEEAKAIIENMREEAYFMSEFNALGVAKRAIEKQIKYRWHDLRKDPNDLPDRCDSFFLRLAGGHGVEYIVGLFIQKHNTFDWDDVVAWKEIEPFEVEHEKTEHQEDTKVD